MGRAWARCHAGRGSRGPVATRGAAPGAAGLERLALDTGDLVTVDLDSDLVVSAPGQGALAIQIREDDAETREVVRRALHDEDTARIVDAERRLLAVAGGGCNLALGSAIDRGGPDGSWRARVFFGPDADNPERPARWAQATHATDPRAAAQAAFERACDPDAAAGGPLAGLRVALCGASAGPSPFGERLRTLGAEVTYEAAVTCEQLPADELRPAIEALGAGDALVITSRRVAPRLEGIDIPDGVCVAAVGSTTARALHQVDIRTDVVGRAGAFDLARRLELRAGATVLHPGPEDSLGELERGFADRDVELRRIAVYRTVPSATVQRAKRVHARVFLSPSAVRATQDAERADGGAERVAFGAATLAALQEAELEAWAAESGHREDIVRHLLERARTQE